MRKIFLIISLLSISGWAVAQSAVCEEGASPTIEKSERAATKSGLNVSYYNGSLYISNANEHAKVEVKNMLGENVAVAVLKSSDARIDLDLKRGFYIVRIENFLQRIVVR